MGAQLRNAGPQIIKSSQQNKVVNSQGVPFGAST